MTSLLSRIQPSSGSANPASETGELIKFVVFALGSLSLALPMKAISRVVNMPQVHSSGLRAVGVTTVGQMELTIVDLHRQLFQTSAPTSDEKPGYLVILPTPSGEPVGIPIAETPLLMDVPTSAIRVLPAAYRQADTLSIASHIARIPTETGELQSIFLLDVQAVMALLSMDHRA